jgi:DNA-binding transcriptional MerR regulator
VCSSARHLNPAEAARQLGVSAKALRLYEQHGLVAPDRTAAGWRAYGPEAMARAAEIVALRALGLSLAQVGRVLGGDPGDLAPALAAHQATLEEKIRQLVGTVEKLRGVRTDLAHGQAPATGELARLLKPASDISVAFDLPWPWGGEQFELNDIRPLTYIIGPLGSGKTRLAMRLAETLPNAAFLGLQRLAEGGAAALAQLNDDPALKSRVDQALAWLVDDGATESAALIALLAGLESEGPAILVVDMVEQGLDHDSQQAVIAWLRQRAAAGSRPLFLMTRSSAILDLATIGTDEAIILCPANHSPPTRVAPYPGAPGYEAVATCLASPEVRARTEGIIAWRPRGNPTT